jgi:ABC-type Co2+ transport system permease subunit
MPDFADLALWAVHVSDGILADRWWMGGFIVAGLLAFWGAWRIREEEIPRIALLTAAFFVASSLLPIRVGPTSVHLLLNGLVGILLGRRCAVAIPVGLLMQVALVGHGGFTTLGINSCVLIVPALFAWQLFALLSQAPWLRRPWFRALLVAACSFTWVISLVYSGILLATNRVTELDQLDPSGANAAVLHPLTLAGAAIVSTFIAWLGSRLETAPEFPLGLLLGEITVLTTASLNCLVLLWGAREDWHTLALLVFLAHLPIAVAEGIILGFTVGFLARVKPEMLSWKEPAAGLWTPSTNGVASGQTADSPLSLTERKQ